MAVSVFKVFRAMSHLKPPEHNSLIIALMANYFM